jgi:hypothetical protein
LAFSWLFDVDFFVLRHLVGALENNRQTAVNAWRVVQAAAREDDRCLSLPL